MSLEGNNEPSLDHRMSISDTSHKKHHTNISKWLLGRKRIRKPAMNTPKVRSMRIEPVLLKLYLHGRNIWSLFAIKIRVQRRITNTRADWMVVRTTISVNEDVAPVVMLMGVTTSWLF